MFSGEGQQQIMLFIFIIRQLNGQLDGFITQSLNLSFSVSDYRQDAQTHPQLIRSETAEITRIFVEEMSQRLCT